MEFLENLMLFILIAASFVVIIAILMLPPKDSNLGTSFGGEEDLNLFGKKKSHGAIAVLERTTIIASTVFMLSAFIYNVLLQYI